MRLIDADVLKHMVKSMNFAQPLMDVTRVLYGVGIEIDNAPTVDAVEVVRCKDCVYWDKNSFTPSSCDDVHWCSFKDLVEYGDWFCADGERRTE